MLLALLLACTSPTGLDALRACADLDCQQATVATAMGLDPRGTGIWLSEQHDPLLQVALVTTLGGHNPALLAGICPRLLPPARQRCDRFVERPHLGPPPKPRPSSDERPGGGPLGTAMRVPDWPQAQADPQAKNQVSQRCGLDPACVDQAARDAGSALRADLAEAACLNLYKDPARAGECRFQAAESAVSAAGFDGLPVALKLCVASAFASDCLSHTLVLILPTATPANQVNPAAVQVMAAAADQIASIIGGPEPRTALSLAASEASDLAWNLWICSAFGISSPGPAASVRGDLLDLVPPTAARHVRFAAASVMVRSRPRATVDALVVATRQALSRRGAPGPNAPRVPVVAPRIGGHLWAADFPGEERVPATWALGMTRRPTSEDPDVDLQLAVISALASNPVPPPAAPLLALLDDQRRPETVRFAAALALSARQPDALRDWAAHHDPGSALVAGRAVLAGSP
ncbi:MAG: hypothetical protein GXP62_12775 [Oligoflexia bacterium]|nr:hypothetical protein [Oligoflexia bacterium]